MHPRAIGNPWSAASHQVKDFLACNLEPYQWLDLLDGGDAQRLLGAAGLAGIETDMAQQPVVIFPDGTHLLRPGNVQIAEKIGLRCPCREAVL